MNFLYVGIERKLASVIFLVVTTIFLAMGIPRIQFDLDLNSLTSSTDPMIPFHAEAVEKFGSDDMTIIVVSDENLWTEDKLYSLEELHYALEDIPFAFQVDSLFTARSIRDVGGSVESSAVMDSAPIDEEEISDARSKALSSPIIVNQLISPDSKTTAFNLIFEEEIDWPRDEYISQDDYVTFVMNETVNEFRDLFEDVYHMGPVRVKQEQMSGIIGDFEILVPLSYATMMLAYAIMLRSPRAVLLPSFTATLSLVWTFGFMGWVGNPVNLLTAMLPTLVVVIGSTEDSHIFAEFMHYLRGEPTSSRNVVLRKTMKHIGVPVLLTTITTVFGFGANIVNEIPMVRDFAMASTFAIAANGLVTVVAVPLLLSWFGPKTAKAEDSEGNKTMTGNVVVDRVAVLADSLVRAYPNAIIVTTLVAIGVFMLVTLNIKVSNDPLSYFPDDHQIVKDSKKLAADLAGGNLFYITLKGEAEGQFYEPESLALVERIIEVIDNNPAFDTATGISEHFSLVNKAFNGDDPEFFVIPDSAELTEQYTLFFRREDLEQYVSNDFMDANIVVRHNISDSSIINEEIELLNQRLQFMVENEPVELMLVGKNLMINGAAERLLAGQAWGLSLLLVVVFVLMSLLFTNVRGGLIALVPNVLPIAMIFGTMTFVGIPINLGTAMVAVITIGIAIDDTIHLMSTYNEESRLHKDKQDAVTKTINKMALPAMSTTISLGAGFSVLTLSNFTVLQQFGILSAMTMAFAILADLLVTPAVLSRVRLVGLWEIMALKIPEGVLQNSPLFEGLTNFQVRKAILLSDHQAFAKGDNLMVEGEHGDDMLMVLDGEVSVVRDTDQGEIVLATLGAGSVVGEIGFTGSAARSATVRASSDGHVLLFNSERMRKGMRLYPHIANQMYSNIAKIIGGRLLTTSEKLIEAQKAALSNEAAK